MKARTIIFSLSALATLLPTTEVAQAKPTPVALVSPATELQATNPPYLREFPSVERVKAEIKGIDPVDTSARQMGAFWQLQQMIKTLAGTRSQNMEFTRDENNLLLRYGSAWQWYQYKDNSPPPQEQARWRKLRDLYENDPGVREELLQKSFAPEFRTAYDRATGKQPPQLATSQPTSRPTAPPAAQPSASAGGSAKAYLAQGEKYLKAQDYANALDAYKKAAGLDPTLVSAYYGISVAAYAVGAHQTQIAALKQITILKPKDAQAFLDLGVFSIPAKQYKEAVAALQQSLRLKPGNASAYIQLGVAYSGLSRHAEAEAALKEAARLEPHNAQAHLNLGNLYVFLKRYPEAVAKLETAIRLAPDSALSYKSQGYHGLGLAYARMGRKEDALKVYRKLLTLDKQKAQELYAEINKRASSQPEVKSGNAASQPASGRKQSSNQSNNSSPQTGANKPTQTAAPKSEAQAIADLEAKAQREDIAAQKKLSDYYYDQAYGDDPDSVPEDISNKMEANGLKWLRKAAESGDVEAQSRLGLNYYNGIRAPKNVEEGRTWLYKAASQGSAAGLEGLCMYYTDPMDLSKGVDPNHFPPPTINSSKQKMTEAFNWCGKAAKTGRPVSTYRLGLLYARGGADIKPDYEQGYFWLRARRQGTRALREAVGNQLTPEKRAEIEARANAWTPTQTPPRAP